MAELNGSEPKAFSDHDNAALSGMSRQVTVTRFLLPDSAVLARTDHAGLASLPVLFDCQYRIRSPENRYLRERALLKWPLSRRRALLSNRGLSRNTLISAARRLQHFADWCDLTERQLQTLRYDDVLEYQAAQAEGKPPYNGRTVCRATANMRADAAADFLLWAAHAGLRTAFPVEMAVGTQAISTGKFVETTVITTQRRSARLSEARNDRWFRFRLPEREAIKAWLDAVRERRGYAKYLICCLMVDTGIRLDEAVSIDASLWPSRSVIETSRSGDPAPMTLQKTKGSVPRTIDVPAGIAKAIRDWIDGPRARLVTMQMDRAGSAAPSPLLFVSDWEHAEGVPIRRHTVYDCFHEVQPRPNGWHPHMARHAFACHYMRSYVEQERKAFPNESGRDWMMQRGDFALHTIRRQFGHISKSTTEIYLRYLDVSFGLGPVMAEFHDRVDGGMH